MLTIAMLVLGAMTLTTLSWALTPESVGPAKAPVPDNHSDAVVQVYGADVWGVRGSFAIHTWVVTKAANAQRPDSEKPKSPRVSQIKCVVTTKESEIRDNRMGSDEKAQLTASKNWKSKSIGRKNENTHKEIVADDLKVRLKESHGDKAGGKLQYRP